MCANRKCFACVCAEWSYKFQAINRNELSIDCRLPDLHRLQRRNGSSGRIARKKSYPIVIHREFAISDISNRMYDRVAPRDITKHDPRLQTVRFQSVYKIFGSIAMRMLGILTSLDRFQSTHFSICTRMTVSHSIGRQTNGRLLQTAKLCAYRLIGMLENGWFVAASKNDGNEHLSWKLLVILLILDASAREIDRGRARWLKCLTNLNYSN